MKLDCAVVKDVYVLYKENELSIKVKGAVDEHLQECAQCNRAYESGEGLNDLLAEAQDAGPSEKLDEKIMLSLKVAKLKLAVFFILAVFMITLLQGYTTARDHMFNDFSATEYSLWQISLGLPNLEYEGTVMHVTQQIEAVNDRQNIILRNLNYFEKNLLERNKFIG